MSLPPRPPRKQISAAIAVSAIIAEAKIAHRTAAAYDTTDPRHAYMAAKAAGLLSAARIIRDLQQPRPFRD